MQINLKQLAMQSLVLLALLAGALFLPAGRLAWTMGWVYLVLFFGFFLGSMPGYSGTTLGCSGNA